MFCSTVSSGAFRVEIAAGPFKDSFDLRAEIIGECVGTSSLLESLGVAACEELKHR